MKHDTPKSANNIVLPYRSVKFSLKCDKPPDFRNHFLAKNLGNLMGNEANDLRASSKLSFRENSETGGSRSSRRRTVALNFQDPKG